MFESKTNYNTKNRGGKSPKSTMDFENFELRLKNINMDISKFSRYSGIARSTIYGWNKEQELAIPLYVERIIELIEIKNKIRNEAYRLFEINTDEPTKSKKIQYKRSA